MKSIALIGANGFVGKAVKKYLRARQYLSTTYVTRENYEEARVKKKYDVILNCAMPSKRFWAEQNKNEDFQATVKRTFNIVNEWESLKIIQVSSISARSQLDTVYGRHKAAAEKLVQNEKNLSACIYFK